jgi:protein TonB
VKSGPTWTPGSGLYIAQFPMYAKEVKLECPAVREQGVSGKVKLKVQVWRTGKVRRVRVVKGMGHGCDEIAIKAIKQMTWKPAIGSNGKPMDHELVYIYEFRPAR